MAITFDSIGTAKASSGSIFSWTHTINSSTNGLLLAFVVQNNSGTIVSPLNFAGNNMTKIIAGTETISSFTDEVWYLKNPPIGLGTFNGTWSGTANQQGYISSAYIGVDQSSPIIGSVENDTSAFSGTFTSGTINRTISDGNWFVGNIWSNRNITSESAGTQRAKISPTGDEAVGDNTVGTLSWVFASGGRFVSVGVELGALVSSTTPDMTFSNATLNLSFSGNLNTTGIGI